MPGRRGLFLGALGALLPMAALAATSSPVSGASEDRRVSGSSTAPVRAAIYFSLTCPHCSAFITANWPHLSADLIDTGKVAWEWLDCPLEPLAVNAAAVLRYLPASQYAPNVVALLTDRSWITGGQAGLKQKLIGLGVASATIDAAFADAVITQWLWSRTQAAKDSSVAGTPTTRVFYPGELAYADLLNRLS